MVFRLGCGLSVVWWWIGCGCLVEEGPYKNDGMTRGSGLGALGFGALRL